MGRLAVVSGRLAVDCFGEPFADPFLAGDDPDRVWTSGFIEKLFALGRILARSSWGYRPNESFVGLARRKCFAVCRDRVVQWRGVDGAAGHGKEQEKGETRDKRLRPCVA